MNGRMYDAVLGRMLSPDNYVQDPTNSQSYNRYSYVLNNPLKYTDPSGWLLTSDVPLKANEEDEGKGGGGGGTVVGENGFFTTDRGLISEIAGVLNNGGTISWTPGTMILNGFGTVTNNGYGQTLNAGYTHIPGSVSVSSYYRNTGSYNYSNTRGSSFAGNVNYYRGGDIDMNNATAQLGGGFTNYGNYVTKISKGAIALISTDVAIPDPTDAAAPKWIGYAVVGAAAAYTLLPTEQYTLRATAPGDYPNFVWGIPFPVGTKYLEAGEIWKIGISVNGIDRYLDSYYKKYNVEYFTEFKGTWAQAKFLELAKLKQYYHIYKALPPGNKMFK